MMRLNHNWRLFFFWFFVLGCSSIAQKPLETPSVWHGGENRMQEQMARFELIDSSYSYDSQGLKTVTTHSKLRILSEEGVRVFGTRTWEWSPWYEERPLVQITVHDHNSAVHRLDPATIAESSASDAQTLTDRKKIAAHLPGVEVGSVIESEVVYKEKAHFFEGGGTAREPIGWVLPIDEFKLRIDAPSSLPIQIEVVGDSTKSTKREEKNRIITQFVWQNVPAWEKMPNFLPMDQANVPHVAISTAKSWNDIATRYAAIVDQKIAQSNIKSFVQEILGNTKRTQSETIALLLTKLQSTIHYAALELGQGAIVPRSPNETLSRKYGDCKDMATLLVAMLREAHIESYVAIVSTQNVPELPINLPGLERFNHAIVYIPGKTPMWIDPTDENSRAGVIPFGDQNRFALIARSGTKELIKTPELSEKENICKIIVNIEPGDLDDGILTERYECSGSYESETKLAVRRLSSSQSIEEYGAKIAKMYDGTLKQLAPDSVESTKGAFGTRTTITNSRWIYSTDDEISVMVVPSYAVRLPISLQSLENLADRKADVAVERGTHELKFRIPSKTGYEFAKLPDPIQQKEKAWSFSTDYSFEKNGYLQVTHRFQILKNRFSAEEARHFAEWVKNVNSVRTTFQLEHAGAKQMKAGNVKEALSTYRKMMKSDTSALTEAQYAMALAKAGFGNEAHRVAKHAAKRDSKSARVLALLGSVLEYNELGEPVGYGWDREGALKAFREAKKIDSMHYGARFELAVTLEHAENGERYRPGADLTNAIDEYKSIVKDFDTNEAKENLIFALFYASRFQEVLDIAKKMEKSSNRNAVVLASIGASEKSEKIIAIANQWMTSEERIAVISTARELLMNLRLYEKAGNLVEMATKGTAMAAEMQPVVAETRQIKLHRSDNSPMGFIYKYITESFAGMKTISPFLSTRHPQENIELRPNDNGMYGSKKERMGDFNLSTVKRTIEGNEITGYRIHAENDDNGYFVIKENGNYRLILGTPDELAQEALFYLEHGNVKAAKQWIDWAYAVSAHDGYANHLVSFVWSSRSKGTADEIRTAAAALFLLGPNSKRAVQLLEQARTTATTVGYQLAMDESIVSHFIYLGDFQNADKVISRIETINSIIAAEWKIRRLFKSGEFTKAVQLAEFQLDEKPDDTHWMKITSDAYAQSGQFMKAIALSKRMIEKEKDSVNKRIWQNDLAFWQLLNGDKKGALENALLANAKMDDPNMLNTLAVVNAESGKTVEAFQLVQKSMVMKRRITPDSEDCYVLGRIAEEYGLPTAAIEYYQRIPKPEFSVSATSVYAVAQKRLSKLVN